MSTDGGESFRNISGNLGDLPAYFSTVYRNGNQLFLGTEVGAFIADLPAPGAQPEWVPMGSGLPNVVVTQFQAQPGNERKIFAGTFGRGVWTYQLGTDGGSSSGGSSSGGSSGVGGASGGRFGGAFGGAALLLLLPLLWRRRRH